VSFAIRLIGKLATPGKIEQKIVANRDFQSSGGFDYRDYRSNARSGFLASDAYPVAAA
jgi:hypothetical protein